MMTLSKEMITKFRVSARMDIDATLETSLLQEFGVEPSPHEYSAQDVYEQVRRKVAVYNAQKAWGDAVM